MYWTTNKNYVVYKTKDSKYYWEFSKYMLCFSDFDTLIPILFTDRQNIAIQTAIKLNRP